MLTFKSNVANEQKPTKKKVLLSPFFSTLSSTSYFICIVYIYTYTYEYGRIGKRHMKKRVSWGFLSGYGCTRIYFRLVMYVEVSE